MVNKLLSKLNNKVDERSKQCKIVEEINTEIGVLQKQLNQEISSICNSQDIEYNLETNEVIFNSQDDPKGSTIDDLKSFLEASDYSIGSAMNGAFRVVAIKFIYD